MPVIHAPATPTHRLPGTDFTSLATPSNGSGETAVWRVSIAPGTAATPHSLTRGEVFVVLGGEARVRIGDTTSTATAGDAIVVPPATEFELVNAGDGALDALCCMPTGGQAVLPGGEPFTPPWAQ